MFKESYFLLLIPLMLICFDAFAGTATQTDWSGGDGIWGPVFGWGNEFHTDTDIECYCSISNILLQKTMALNPLEHTVSGDFVSALSVYSSDVNGDGYLDVLGAAYSGVEITWWENMDGSGTSWIEHIVDDEFIGAHELSSADVDGDGCMDILGAAVNDDDITWWENIDGSGTSWTKHTVAGDYDGACSVDASDVNGDGYMDVLGAASVANEITWWENLNGSGISWTEHTICASFVAPRRVRSADVNGDGYMDVLGAAEVANDITWWENLDGSGTSWTEHTVDGDFAGPKSVYAADVNGDGYMDVLGAAYLSNEITWWENLDGSGTSWTEHTVDGDFAGAFSVYSADLNKDGYWDVLGAACYDDDITWWENMDGSGTSWTEHTIDGDFDYANSVYAADVNGDSYMDILGAAFYANDITWWDLTEFLPDGLLESSVLDVQESPDWETLDWTGAEPPGTEIAFQVRASDNSSSMGDWSDILTVPCALEGILDDEDNFFQYRVILNTTDSLLTPVLHDVTINWQPFTGTQEGSTEAVALALYGAQPNPACGFATLVFELPVDTSVELTVYDLTGRAVRFICDQYEGGMHQVRVEDLACGVYIVRMVSEDHTLIRQFVVLE